MNALEEPQNIEIRLLLEAIYLKYGYDFRHYSRASIKRRILRRKQLSDLASISEIQHKVLYDPVFFKQLLQDLSINVTEMFRDPSFYRALRKHVIPCLSGLDEIKIWHAGCATGEEVYSLAILLFESGVYGKCRIYATDFSDNALKKAEAGIYPFDQIKAYTLNYRKTGGAASFADYYTARHESAVIRHSLKRNITFANHNLATDGVFGEMDMVLCRNVLIYFDRHLQNKVFRLLCDSLSPRGFLCLGAKESVRFAEISDLFVDVEPREKIYRKKGKGRIIQGPEGPWHENHG